MNLTFPTTYRYEIVVIKYNEYRAKLWEKPGSFTAPDKDALFEKVKVAFGAVQDRRGRWDHGYRIVSVTEVAGGP